MFTTDLLELDVQEQGTTRLVTLTGEVDMATAGRAEAVVRAALDGTSETVMLDLAGVTFIDSSGLHMILRAAALAARRALRFIVLPGPPHIQRVFELAGVADYVPFTR